MSFCCICQQYNCGQHSCQQHDSHGLDLLVAAAGCLDEPPAKRIRLESDVYHSTMPFSVWHTCGIKYLNQHIITLRLANEYDAATRKQKNQLIKFRDALFCCTDYQSVWYLLAQFPNLPHLIMEKFNKALLARQIADTKPTQQVASIKPEYVRATETLCAVQIEAIPALAKELQEMCADLNVALQLLPSRNCNDVWIRDRYIAMEKENIGHYLQWEGHITHQQHLEVNSLFKERNYSYLKSADSMSPTCLQYHYDLRQCPLLPKLNDAHQIEYEPFHIQGGNLIVVQRADASKVVLLGENSLVQQVAMDQTFTVGGMFTGFTPTVHAGSHPLYIAARRKQKVSLYKLFGLAGNDSLTILPDADFHLDCYLFSPCPNIVVVNDFSQLLSAKFMTEVKRIYGENMYMAITRFASEQQPRINAILDVVCQKLQKKGLTVLRAALSLPSLIYTINEKKYDIGSCFNLANGISIDSRQSYHFCIAKSCFSFLEDQLSQLLKQHKVTLHSLGYAPENEQLLTRGGALRCVSNAFSPGCLKSGDGVTS